MKLKIILLIEDDANYAKVLTYHLGKEGYAVHCCATGKTALAYLCQLKKYRGQQVKPPVELERTIKWTSYCW